MDRTASKDGECHPVRLMVIGTMNLDQSRIPSEASTGVLPGQLHVDTRTGSSLLTAGQFGWESFAGSSFCRKSAVSAPTGIVSFRN